MAKHNTEPSKFEQQSKQSVSASQSEDEPIGKEGHASSSTAFTFRLTREELAVLEQAASRAGVTVSEYLRKAAALRPTTSVLTRPQFNLSVSTPYFQYGSLVTWNESPTPITYVSDFQATSKGIDFRLHS